MPVLGVTILAATGCSFPGGGSELYHTTYSAHIPAMRDSQDKILNVGCKLTSASLNPLRVDGHCDVALSTAVSDLANDIHTAIDVVNAVTGGHGDDIESAMLSAVSSRCKIAVDSSLQSIVNQQSNPTVKAFLQSYLAAHVNTASLCANSVSTLWNETNNNTYSGGHNCAAMHINASFQSVNSGPSIGLSTYAINESSTTYPGCPRERTSPIPGVYWGNG